MSVLTSDAVQFNVFAQPCHIAMSAVHISVSFPFSPPDVNVVRHFHFAVAEVLIRDARLK